MRAYRIMYQTGQLIWLPNVKGKIGKHLKVPYLYLMKIKFLDDQSIVIVESYKELVEYMRASSPYIPTTGSNLEYMKGYAKRAVISRNHDIRATDETAFVEDLIKYKHIQVMENGQN